MKGHVELVQARIEGWPIAVVDLYVDGKPDFWKHGKGWHFGVAVEADGAGTLDLRCCHGLPVFVHADSYEAGWPVFERALEFEPMALYLCAPEIVLRVEGEEIEQLWER